MSDTPMTDAAIYETYSEGGFGGEMAVPPDVCRQLEHELAASQAECAELRSVLSDARVKLQLYRSAHSGEYVGGVEYSELLKMIDAAMKGE